MHTIKNRFFKKNLGLKSVSYLKPGKGFQNNWEIETQQHVMIVLALQHTLLVFRNPWVLSETGTVSVMLYR